MAPVQWRDATFGGQDTTGLSLDLPCTEDPELFFAESPQDVEQAKAMCRGCQARLACLVLVVVLDDIRPCLVTHPAGGVGDASALLGQFQGGSLGLGEDRGLPPGRDQVEAHRGFPACAASAWAEFLQWRPVARQFGQPPQVVRSAQASN